VGGAGQADVEGRALSEQPWGGRFGEEPDPLIDRFTRSLAVDSRLLREDIAGSATNIPDVMLLQPDENPSMSMEPRWRIELLGGLRALRGDVRLTRFRTRLNVSFKYESDE